MLAQSTVPDGKLLKNDIARIIHDQEALEHSIVRDQFAAIVSSL